MLTPEALPVLAAITVERDRQLAELGWTSEHDDRRGAMHLLGMADNKLIKCALRGEVDRAEIVEAAALLVAAIEVLDRLRSGSEHPGTWIEAHDHASCVECGCPCDSAP